MYFDEKNFKLDSFPQTSDKFTVVAHQNEPAGRILEFCILNLAMSEIAVLGKRHQTVINEVTKSSLITVLLCLAYVLNVFVFPMMHLNVNLMLFNCVWSSMKAIDLAKRYCDGAAPRVINGCLRTFVKDLSGSNMTQASEANQKAEV